MWHFLRRLIPASVCTTLAVLSLSALAGPFAYVTNFNSDSVSVIDTASNTVVATVLVPASHWPNSVAVNPDGTRVYITSGKWPGGNIGRVSVIDTATNAVIATVEVGDYQGKIALNPAGTRAYVSYTGMCCPNVSVIDTASNTVVATVPLAIPDQRGQVVYPAGVAVNPAGTRVYVSQGYLDSQGASVGAIYVIDTASNTVVDALVMGSPMGYMVFNHAGTRAYVARQWEPSVSVIDTSTNTIVGTIPVVGGYPTFVAIAPDDTRLYVSNINDGLNPSVSVIDLTSNTVVATVLVGGVPYGVAVNPAGTFAYVPVADKNYVAVIDTRTNTVVGTVVVGTNPGSIAIGPPEWVPPPPPPLLPQINVVSPSSGPAGTAVSLYGVNFGVLQGTSVVKFDTTQASIGSWSDTRIDVIAPAGLSGTVTITVTTTAGTSSGVLFSYPVPPAFSLSRTFLDFGTVATNATSTAKTVSVANVGGPGLLITGVTLGGVNASDFQIVGM